MLSSLCAVLYVLTFRSLFTNPVLALPLPASSHPPNSYALFRPHTTPPDLASTSQLQSTSQRARGEPFRFVDRKLASHFLRPYLVSLLSLTSRTENFSCTATLLSARWLITAANCVVSQNTLVSLGTNNTAELPNHSFIRVAHVISLAEYNMRQHQYDIAVVKLAQPLPTAANFMKVNVNAGIPRKNTFVTIITNDTGATSGREQP